MVLAVGGLWTDGLEAPRPSVAALMRAATGFAGGLGDSGDELCGALSGGVMVIGALLGRSDLREDDRPAVLASARYRERFIDVLGYAQCRQLRDKVVNARGGPNSCAELVERAATLLVQQLNSPR